MASNVNDWGINVYDWGINRHMTSDELEAWFKRWQELTPYEKCTCHPDEAPVPCQRLYALSECQKASQMTAGQKLVQIIRKTTPAPLFSMEDAPVYCELCRRAVNQGLNTTMRWPNDISGYPGDAVAAREEDAYGPITSRTRWLKGAGTDYR